MIMPMFCSLFSFWYGGWRGLVVASKVYGSSCHYDASERRYLKMKQNDLVKSLSLHLEMACLQVCSRPKQCS